jgi:hypothetical protein
MYYSSLQHKPNSAKTTGLLKSLTASMQHQNLPIRFEKLIKSITRRRPALSTRLHSTNFMYCPSVQRQPNSAKSTGLLKSLKPIETAAKYYNSTRKTSYQRGPEALRAHHTISYHHSYIQWQKLPSSLIDAVIHRYTSHCGIQPISYNGIRRARLYMTCHTCRTLHQKFAYIIHESMLCLCIHRYVYVCVHVGLDSKL